MALTSTLVSFKHVHSFHLMRSEHSSEMALTSPLVSFKHVHSFHLMRTHVTHTLRYTFLFHSCVSRACTLHASALSPLVSSYGVSQLATMGFFILMKGSARNVFTLIFVMFNDTLKSFPLPLTLGIHYP